MTTTEQTYVEAYRNVVRAVANVNSYVTPLLGQQVDHLETLIADDARIEELRERAWWTA